MELANEDEEFRELEVPILETTACSTEIESLGSLAGSTR